MNNNTEREFHIGGRIREVLAERGLTVDWLACRIPCERSNVYNIFRRETIDAGLLFCISQALGHDFFAELSVMLVRSGGIDKKQTRPDSL